MFFFKKRRDFRDLDRRIECAQKTAWMLVRAAEDKFSNVPGDQKLVWASEILLIQIPELETISRAENFVRAAFVNFRIETGDFQRRLEKI